MFFSYLGNWLGSISSVFLDVTQHHIATPITSEWRVQATLLLLLP